MTNDAGSKVVICRGALATERRLLSEIDRLRPRTASELGSPVRVIVPSRSLRLHLLRRMAETFGAVAGVAVQTLGGAAREIVERTGRGSGPCLAGFELTVRRAARDEPVLAGELDDLDDGYGAVLGAVRDLTDAAFEPSLADGVLEQIDELGSVVPRSDRERAAALVRVAARALTDAERTGAYPRAAAYRQAAEALADAGGAALPTRALVIHGFADLTGVAADLLTGLLRVRGGTVLLDRVPDPVAPAQDDAGNAFLDRLEIRLGGVAKEVDESAVGRPAVGFIEAPDVEAEARAVAEAVRAEIADGARPEGVGVVCRQPGLMGLPLRRQLRRLGVPFSGIAAAVAGGRVRRKARRLADLLRCGGDAELDLWVEVSDGLADEVALLLGLRVLSLTRLRDLAELRADDPKLVRGVPLPLDPGISGDAEEPEGKQRAPRLTSDRAAPAIDRAGVLLGVLEDRPGAAPVSVHLEWTGRLLEALGWSDNAGHREAVMDAAAGLAAELAAVAGLDSAEWSAELVRRLDAVGDVAVGGRGGGVQLLSVTEARGRTFDRLFLCGVTRGVFPRLVHDDALLPDAVRSRLAVAVLPEMPVKARSADEERYLFAQLMSAASQVVVSWHLSRDGKRAAPSPFVERLRGADPDLPQTTAPPLWSERPDTGPRPAYEHAVIAATRGTTDGALLTSAITEGRAGAATFEPSISPDRLAAARLDVVHALREIEDERGTISVAPWFGFVGDATTPGDRLWVTHLEAVAECPWRAFVERRLGVRPLPDPHLGLPEPDNRLVGSVVHAVLERIVDPAAHPRQSLTEALGRTPRTVRWPTERELDELLADAAERVAYDEGLGGFGLARLLAARARPLLAVARDVEWAGGTAIEGVLAAEITGEVADRPGGRVIGFRADRLDVGPCATDYKSGKPLSCAKNAETRERHLLAKVRAGHLLQAAAYALAAPGGVGRYLYLRPDIGDAPDDARDHRASGDDPEIAAAFDRAVAVIIAALEAGAAFPMIDEPKGKSADPCAYCQIEEACRRGDTAVRQRLNELMTDDRIDETSEIAAARDLWWLGVDREAGR